MKKDWKRHIAYEVIVILGMFALLMFLCRLWPIIFLCILGIFIAAIRLLFLSSKKVEVVEPLPLPALPEPKPEPTETDVKELAYSVILRKITQLVCSEYPDARWVWEASNAKELIFLGEDVFILLNRAGGYRRAKVVISNLQVLGIDYNLKPEKLNDEDEEDPVTEGAETPTNYDLVAFEWVDAHISVKKLTVDLTNHIYGTLGREFIDLCRVEDFVEQIESWEEVGRLSDAVYKEMIADKSIPERIHSKLGKNDGYWEHYWESVSEVGHDVVREYSLKNTHSDGENAKNDAQGGV